LRSKAGFVWKPVHGAAGSLRKLLKMKQMITATLVVTLVSIGLLGCGEQTKSTIKQETKISTPGGTTTITTERDVKKTGDSPPPVRP
jgi:hypothetical protein